MGFMGFFYMGGLFRGKVAQVALFGGQELEDDFWGSEQLRKVWWEESATSKY